MMPSLPAISVRPDFVNGGYEGGVENYRSFHFDSNQEDKSLEEVNRINGRTR